MRLEELQSTTRSNLQLTQSISPGIKEETLRTQSPLTLFKEMNRAAFGKKEKGKEQNTVASPVLVRGKQVKASVFDSVVSSAAPSALMKASTKASKREESMPEAVTSQTNKNSSVDSDSSPEQEGSLMESPLLLAVKAIGIATALVGTGAYLSWEIARRVLGVQNVSVKWRWIKGVDSPSLLDRSTSSLIDLL